MRVYTAPEAVDWIAIDESDDEKVSVFLAGSIEMDKAEKWQNKVIDHLSHLQVAVFNPRRESWDSSWKQEMSNPQFNEQVNWELDQLNEADVIFFYFDPATKSPITLMELGYVLGQRATNVIVVCPHGFWRRGNIEIICSRSNVPLLSTFADGLGHLTATLELELSLLN